MKIKENILLIIFALAFFGIYYSRTILSFYPYVLLLYGLTSKNGIKRTKSFFTKSPLVSFAFILIIYIASGVNSTDTHAWLGRINTNLIYLVLPLAIYINGPYERKFINKVLALFVIINSVISIYLFTDYISHYESINTKYLRGQTISTPVIHVRYSYFVATTVIFAIYLYVKKFKFKYDFETKLYGILALFSIIFLHILAVRTGLLALYISGIFWAFYYGIKYKKYKLSSIVAGVIILFIVSSYSLIPSFQNKVKYVIWDIKNTLNNDSQYHTSDRIRIYSIINGLKLWKESPALGTGIGDIEKEMDKKYKLNYPSLPQDMRFTPINQFVFILASMGTVGFILFFGFLLYPLFSSKHIHELLLLFYILTFATFIGETTIELMIGKTAFLTLASLLLVGNETTQDA